MHQERTEGTTRFITDSDEKITKDMPVFYNPVMKFNRDLTLAMLLAMRNWNKSPSIGLPMEASGLRAARILHELVAAGHLLPKRIALNDLSPEAIAIAEQNIAHTIGSYPQENVRCTTDEASRFLRASPAFDYIDIDPFGTPNPFLDAAVQRVARNGILAVTATDTSAFAGTYPAATARKYWAVPTRTWLMHDAGLRILIRKVQLIAAQYERALFPVLSVSTDHYYRVFFMYVPGNAQVKTILKQHQFLHVCTNCMQLALSHDNVGVCAACGEKIAAAGPLWTGKLHDVEIVRQMRAGLPLLDAKTAKSLDTFLAIIEDECKIETVGFCDIHELVSRMKIQAPRTEFVLEKLGVHGCKTHINGAGVKVDISIEKLRELLR